MGKRIFSTLILWVIVAATIYFGKSAGWSVLILILSAGSIKEVCDLLEHLKLSPMRKTLQLANIAIFVAAFLGECIGFPLVGGVFAFLISIVVIAISIVKRPYDGYTKNSVLPTILTLLAVPLSLQWLVVASVHWTTPSDYTGIIVAIWIVASAKFSDVGAYVIGAAFGRHKMSPTISPNKTWEGAVGGLLSSAVISVIVFGFAHSIMPLISIIVVMIVGVVIGAIAIVSDLLESVLKRRADIKDSGKFIPGIGGALDLSDSLLLSTPIAFIIFILISQL